ncbi:MAG: hypothetical protein EOO46_09680 [Flavobacterium sp.]|nr:MAG: hypothetical protein EOO46_09680 [Flavobacterium sp.]
MTTIKIQRTSEYNNKLRDFGIYVDGIKVGTIADGEVKEFTTTPGTHVVAAKIDWCSSQNVSVEVVEGKAATLEVGGFKFGNWILPLVIGVVIVFIALQNFAGSEYILFAFVPLFVFLFYYLTVGRKKYLRLAVID